MKAIAMLILLMTATLLPSCSNEPTKGNDASSQENRARMDPMTVIKQAKASSRETYRSESRAYAQDNTVPSETERMNAGIDLVLEEYEKRLNTLFNNALDMETSNEAMTDIRVKYYAVSTAARAYLGFYRQVESYGAQYGQHFSPKQKRAYEILLDRSESYHNLATEQAMILESGL